MIDKFPKYLLQFIVLLVAQIFIFNNIEIGGFFNPYIYILFILLLPFSTPAWMILLGGFALGLSMDIFSETLGMHTSASVFMAFTRPYILSYFAPHDGYKVGSQPRVEYYGIAWFMKYAIIMVLIHHTFLFYVEMFRFQDFFTTFLRVILSSLFSSALIIISQYFVFRK